MASSGSSAKRYAQVVFQLAVETKSIDKWQQDLAAIANLAGQKQAAQLLRNPRFPLDARRKVLEESLIGSSAQALNLATLLVSQGRLDEMAAPVEAEFQKLVEAAQGIVRAQITTAVAVDAAQERGISDSLAKATGKTIKMESRVDPDILGGMVVRLGDRLIDGSVRTNLNGLRRSLAEGQGLK